MNQQPQDEADKDDGTDFCHTCDEVTAWDGEFCSKCHREWGYQFLPRILNCGCCEHCGCGCS